MAFEGPGKFFAGKDVSLDHDERLRLHETVLVRHADYGRFEHALMSRLCKNGHCDRGDIDLTQRPLCGWKPVGDI
jgi:hypothetical protein